MIKNILTTILIIFISSNLFAQGDPFTKRLTRDGLSSSTDSSSKEPAIFKKKVIMNLVAVQLLTKV